MSEQFLASEHPYYPQWISLPGYAPAKIPYSTVLTVFFSSTAALFLAAYLLSGRVKHLKASDRAALCWFLLTGIIHLVIEGAFVLDPFFYRNTSDANLLAEIWKEYSKADSRYATRDSFVVSMEAITAFLWGPICFLIVCGIAARKPWRHTLILLVSCGQLYGDLLYFGTTWLEGLIHSRPEAWYFWFYFVFINSIWVVVPLWCLIRAADSVGHAVAVADRDASKLHKQQ